MVSLYLFAVGFSVWEEDTPYGHKISHTTVDQVNIKYIVGFEGLDSAVVSKKRKAVLPEK